MAVGKIATNRRKLQEPRARLLVLLDKDTLPEEYSHLTTEETNLLAFGLTLGQWKFVRAFCACMNATEAVMEVYSVADKQSAQVQGRRLLAVPKIKAAIALILAEFGEKTNIKKSALVHLAMNIAMSPAAKDADKIKAIELVAKMTGSIVDEKRRDDQRKVPKVVIEFSEDPAPGTTVSFEEAKEPSVLLEHGEIDPIGTDTEDNAASGAAKGVRVPSD